MDLQPSGYNQAVYSNHKQNHPDSVAEPSPKALYNGKKTATPSTTSDNLQLSPHLKHSREDNAKILTARKQEVLVPQDRKSISENKQLDNQPVDDQYQARNQRFYNTVGDAHSTAKTSSTPMTHVTANSRSSKTTMKIATTSLPPDVVKAEKEIESLWALLFETAAIERKINKSGYSSSTLTPLATPYDLSLTGDQKQLPPGNFPTRMSPTHVLNADQTDKTDSTETQLPAVGRKLSISGEQVITTGEKVDNAIDDDIIADTIKASDDDSIEKSKQLEHSNGGYPEKPGTEHASGTTLTKPVISTGKATGVGKPSASSDDLRVRTVSVTFETLISGSRQQYSEETFRAGSSIESLKQWTDGQIVKFKNSAIGKYFPMQIKINSRIAGAPDSKLQVAFDVDKKVKVTANASDGATRASSPMFEQSLASLFADLKNKEAVTDLNSTEV